MTEPEQQPEQPSDDAAGEPTASAGPADDRADLERELADMRDRLLRTQAELDNVRKRARRDLEDERRYACQHLIGDLLPVLDNVQRAVESAEASGDAAGLVEGVRMVAQQLDDVLARHHCTRIDALHQPFDPSVHEAVMQQPNDDHPPQTVVGVVQHGFQLHDRVIRPTQVIVSALPPPKE